MLRLTSEIGPQLPESIAFSADEAGLCIRAISYRAHTSMQTLEGNWDIEGLRAVFRSPEGAIEDLTESVDFLAMQQEFAQRFRIPEEDGRRIVTVDFTPIELSNLGDTLYRYGVFGIGHASRAISDDGSFRMESIEKQSDTLNDLGGILDNTFRLFKELEPIARSKSGFSWMIWDEARSKSVFAPYLAPSTQA